MHKNAIISFISFVSFFLPITLSHSLPVVRSLSLLCLVLRSSAKPCYPLDHSLEMTHSFFVFLAFAASVHAHAGLWGPGMYCKGVCCPFLHSESNLPGCVRTRSDSMSLDRRVTLVKMIRTAMPSSNPCTSCLSTNGGVSRFNLPLLRVARPLMSATNLCSARGERCALLHIRLRKSR